MRVAGLAFALLSALGTPAQLRSTDLLVGGGYACLPDSGFCDRSRGSGLAFLGGSARFYLSSRWAFQPEFSYLSSARNEHYAVMPNFTVDFAQSARGNAFALFGLGYLRQSYDFGHGYTNGATLSVGIGLKYYISKNTFVAPELRLGSGAFLRAGASIGYTFGRR